MTLTFDHKHLLATINILVEPHARAYADAGARRNAARSENVADAWTAMDTYIQAAYRLMKHVY
jgi:hypothetical protein